MVEPLIYLRDRAQDFWLVGLDSQRLAHLAEIRYRELQLLRTQKLPTIFLCEADPVTFLASFVAACAAQCPIFLGDPNWVARERQQLIAQIQPDLVWGSVEQIGAGNQSSTQSGNSTVQVDSKFKIQNPKSLPQPGWIMISTGGSSGQIRFAIHTWQTLTASVAGFRQYFGVKQVNSWCTLPLYHVSGLMQFIRSLISGGKMIHLPFNSVDQAMETAKIHPSACFLSLVPTQLQRLLQSSKAITYLSQFRTILLGGAPAWTELLLTAKQHHMRLAPTYGMTETASQVATLKPVDFLRGQTGCGQALPHAHITIQDQNGQLLAPNQIGLVMIKTSSLALGYYPELFQSSEFHTDDLGYLDTKGYLHIVGRSSRKIITGGEKVFPTEVEAVIRSTGLVSDVCVLGLPDPDWGEAVTAVYVPTTADVTTTSLRAALCDRMSRFKYPKRWIALHQIPYNAQGKVNYKKLKQLLLS